MGGAWNQNLQPILMRRPLASIMQNAQDCPNLEKQVNKKQLETPSINSLLGSKYKHGSQIIDEKRAIKRV